MNERVKNQFNLLSDEYDARRRLIIPCFDDFYFTGISTLFYDGENPRVLDIGAGTGLYSSALLTRYPKAKLTLIDFAENMLDIAKDKFSGLKDASYLLDDYFTHDYRGETYDIIISALSIHHLDEEDKQKLYIKLYSLLEPGGEFLNADIISAGYPALDVKYDSLWTEFVAANAGEGEYFERFLKSKEVDMPSTAKDQLHWLSDAGFSEAGCVYAYLNFAVLYARK